MRAFREVMSWVFPIAIGLIIALLIKTYWFTLVRVDGTSMEPNLVNNERVFVFKTEKIHRGSVIVFDAYGEDPSATSDKDYVKRVIGMPGDTVSAVNGVIKVNGKKINQNYISELEQTETNTINNVGNWNNLKELGTRQDWQRKIVTKVPKGEYFVLGDHRSVSNDSRYWGFVSKDKVLGVVKVPFWGSSERKTNINKEWKNFFVE